MFSKTLSRIGGFSHGRLTGPIQTKTYTKSKYKLINLAHSHFWRWVRYTLLGILMTGISFGILFLQVHNGIKPTYAYLVENVFMLQLGFALNRYLTFGDRSLPFWPAVFKWNAFKSVTFVLGQGLYFLLIHIAGLQYMLASVTVAATFGIFSYVLSNSWAFAKQKSSS